MTSNNPQQYLDPVTLAKLKGLAVKARLLVEGYLSGMHRSPMHGFAVEFAEHREYVPGDDLRYVDWKAYGKSDRYYLKQFEEETNFACYIVLDTSESMTYRSDSAVLSKLDYARLLAAALSYLVLRQRDAVGLVTVAQSVGQFIGASSRPSQLKLVCDVMENATSDVKTTLGPVFHDLAERIRKRSLIILFSDFLDDMDSLTLGLRHLHHRRHDVSLFHLIDPAEQDFPFDHPTMFRGLEGWANQLIEPRALRAGYCAEFESFLTRLRHQTRGLDMDHVVTRTDAPFDLALSTFLKKRTGRVPRS